MNEVDKNKIFKNLLYLVNETKNFEQLINILVEKRVFNDFMVKKIQGQNGITEKLHCMYQMIPKRGPEAFKKLTDALHESGNGGLALRLKSNRTLNNNSEEVDATPFRSPPDVNGENELQNSHQPDIFFDQNEVYPMTEIPRGYMLIVNIYKFDYNSHKKRIGSEKDVSSLKKIAKVFGFKVEEAHDVGAKDFVSFIRKFCDDKRAKNSVLVFIMSHGVQPKELATADGTKYYSPTVDIIMRDNHTVSSDWVVEQFSTQNCPALAGKPKIIMFTACRGNTPDKGITIEADAVRVSTYPSTTDLLTVFPCLPGNVSYRNELGTFMVQEFVRVLKKQWERKDIISILQEVTANLKRTFTVTQNFMIVNFTLLNFDKKFFFKTVTPEEYQQILAI